MNRVVNQIVVAGLCVAFIPSAHALFHHKKKKGFNLSANPLANVNSEQPDKILYDKAMHALKKGRYDVARLDLQTLLNTYPETEYAMRAKLAIGDTWYKEGGSAALSQAESEYQDFITFFPNTPEAAEAQMKIGDIYFQQMLKPDRDPANALQAQQQYRVMLQDFPDSPLIPRAKQRLRDVQEVLAQRQFEIGEFYASREDWAGAIARLQTVVDTYPLFSRADEALITLGDAYATEAQIFRRAKLPAKAKAELVRIYDDRAAAAWDRVVTRYPMAPHVDDAKDRLVAMGRPIPEPTPAELAESEAEEGSRMTLKLKDRALLLIKQSPSTVRAARVGEPTITDPPQTYAPQINRENIALFEAALHGQPLPGVGPHGLDKTAVAISNGSSPPPPPPPAQESTSPLQLQSIPQQNGGGSTSNTVTVSVPSGSAQSSSASGNASGSPGSSTAPATAAGDNAIVKPVGPVVSKPLPPIDKPAATPDQINDVQGNPGSAQVYTGTAAGKKKHKKAPYNSKEESSSRHHKKKGLGKLNPF